MCEVTDSYCKIYYHAFIRLAATTSNDKVKVWRCVTCGILFNKIRTDSVYYWLRKDFNGNNLEWRLLSNSIFRDFERSIQKNPPFIF
jgi:Zn-finger protein